MIESNSYCRSVKGAAVRETAGGDEMERNIALKLMYNGTAYHGWQIQKNAISVAETLEKALSTVVCHPVKCTGAGRTDALRRIIFIPPFRRKRADTRGDIRVSSAIPQIPPPHI